MKRIIVSLSTIIMVLALAASSCQKSNTSSADPENGGEDTDNPNNTGEREVSAWVDLANVFADNGRFRDTAMISKTLDTMKEVGITSLVIGVKSSSGYTIYPSNFTKKIVSENGNSFPANVDYVDFMVKAAHKRHLKIFSSTNVFVEGDAGTGLVFEDAAYKNYEAVVCKADGKRVPITSQNKPGFVNPAIPEVQAHAIDLLKELVQKYDIDGIILDYCRYADITADFSDFSKNAFIKFLEDKYDDKNARYMQFPQDIVTTWKNNGGSVVPDQTGKYFRRWLLWRVSVIYDFVKKAKAEIKKIKPNAAFGSYVGSWYSSYYEVGVNWASQSYDPFSDQNIRFDWAYPDYDKYGYADELDLLMTGNYAAQIMMDDNAATAGQQYNWWVVEGSLNGGMYVTRNKIPLYGSMDLGNIDYASKDDVTRGIKMILSKTNHVMLFDLIHIYAPEYSHLHVPLWNEVKEGLKK